MASSYSSEDKCPKNFQISNDEVDISEVVKHKRTLAAKDESPPQTGGHTLKCPLCGRVSNKFNCRNCVKNGSFVHTVHSQQDFKESLKEQQQQFLKIQAELKKTFADRYEKENNNRKLLENIHFEIAHKKKNNDLLKKLIAKKQNRLDALKAQRDELRHNNLDKRKNLPCYPIKVKELEDYVLDRIEKISKLRDQYTSLLQTIQQYSRRSIQQLVEFIFPISEIVLKDEQRQQAEAAARNVPPGSEELETIAALADAKNTSYIRGKWVFHGSGISEMQYRIVAPSLPATGDYAAYIDWLSENKDDVRTANEITPSRIAAFRIMGALTYTSQLTQLMSYYLNVRLPFKLAYSDFCKKLNEEQFLRKVSRLNSNIFFLGYTQKLKLRLLNEQHTLENILAILDLERSDLGRCGHNEVANAPLIKSVDSLLFGIETTTESESEDENSLRLDWEVPTLTQQVEGINANMLPATAQQSTNAEGLMTSAANRITSIWRWMK